ncbi:hypothetical protein HMPREF0058_1850 [Actinomyces urogenitalis DSM 15434]|uniref:Uncharacterized protein n=1 Tax=Actinomyces urogenitalis DSM 15434 TaxID=525246 RepID=C0W7K6_9ACTO|nr:hypothetical protein HMPREF0058_1850 [Actinomyces urogenitalis DSM 15434]
MPGACLSPERVQVHALIAGAMLGQADGSWYSSALTGRSPTLARKRRDPTWVPDGNRVMRGQPRNVQPELCVVPLGT